jgi:hypothetical protein
VALVSVALESESVRLALDRTKALGVRALEEPLCLEAVPPLGEDPYPYGDLVPLGFVALALREAAARLPDAACENLAERLRHYLLERRSRGLWSYHHGGLETSIDSGLVMLGLSQPESVAALENFSDGHGGYVPQLHTEGVEPGKMTVRESLRHWCRPDYSIACLVRALRSREGLSRVTPVSVLEMGFAQRSGLYLANPYFPDWLAAMAIEGDAEADSLRSRLREEVAASVSPDGTFGSYDVLLSTSFAVLSLQSLGVERSFLERSLASLASLVVLDAGGSCTPFYSTEQVAWSQLPAWELLYLLTAGGGRHLIGSAGQEHAITFYQDSLGLIAYSLALLALLRGPVNAAKEPVARREPHERYLCRSPEDYIALFALPPYLAAEAA